MDRNIYDNDFEDFLKQKSDQYKMYPSDRVWNNVYSSLHGRKKWWALGLGLFFIGAGLLVGKEVLLSNFNQATKDFNESTETFSATNKSTKYTVKNTATPAVANANGLALSNTRSNSIQTNTKTSKLLPVAETVPRSINNSTAPVAGMSTSAGNNNNEAEALAPANAETSLVIESNLISSVPVTSGSNLAATSFSIPAKDPSINKDIAGKDQRDLKEQATQPINQVENAAAAIKLAGIKESRFSLQFYASPTISYRRLSTISQSDNTVIPVATGYAGNINRYVRHKPAPGFELGTNVQYKLSENLTVFAGAQLNYSRYYIDAFKYSTEKASLAVNNAMVRDTLSGYTNIRNFNGYAPEQLQNKYLQLSVPVGIEIKLLGRKKLQFSVAGGVQPTFLLSSNSYLISSDYKNYIQSPDLARGFNVHTNFEAFISYKVAGLKWQVGPQFRSQLLSSYSNQYRVREYLTEYGIKFGVSKSF